MAKKDQEEKTVDEQVGDDQKVVDNPVDAEADNSEAGIPDVPPDGPAKVKISVDDVEFEDDNEDVVTTVMHLYTGLPPDMFGDILKAAAAKAEGQIPQLSGSYSNDGEGWDVGLENDEIVHVWWRPGDQKVLEANYNVRSLEQNLGTYATTVSAEVEVGSKEYDKAMAVLKENEPIIADIKARLAKARKIAQYGGGGVKITFPLLDAINGVRFHVETATVTDL